MLRTPFYNYNVEHGAKMVDFAGWEMPILYSSILEEHKHVRTGGGLFDVSHMGRIEISGRHARKVLERLLTRRVTDMAEMTCRYSLICNERGGIIDDVIVYRFPEHWMLVVNASNREKVLAHLKTVIADSVVKVEDRTQSTAMVALQGPRVMEHIARFSREIPTLKRYAFAIKNVLILKMTISRTGYTGEDGVEVILPGAMASMAIKMLIKEKSDDPTAVIFKPCGLGARDTLRLEAGMPLYGHELDENTDPLSAGLGWAVTLDKDQQELGEKFVGQDALKAISAEIAAGTSTRRKLVGLKLEGKRTPRQGMVVRKGDAEVGKITSGCLSPTLGYPIAMAYVDPSAGAGDAVLNVAISDEHVPAQVVPLPFYKRAK